jgi:hypothetical protein
LASLRRGGAIRGGIEVRWVSGRREIVTEKGVPRACKGYKCQMQMFIRGRVPSAATGRRRRVIGM